ncbi:DUF411 domain-containing protein [Luteimonas sp. 50]|uniref:DUF411 domain-containing protein n=1 Tax=Cognatiluteimonas sedimenti TaxID=2927791 RepID=A0ABT0A1D2_9GAMM|nr:DUF411 domain-containing protein [Lysobacter sedimenti]MCJ0824779.1 DUF411 domain-containing protein [Lysobacter sedimenti]
MKSLALAPALLGLALALASCTPTSAAPGSTSDDARPVTAAAKLPLVVVHKNASCGCCNDWIEHVRAAGFRVQVRNEVNLNPIKERVGVPLGKGSCHTAEVDGYFVEGHVPAADIKRLLAERPAARGLVLPGMPIGSPGMESPDGRSQPYTVELVGFDGGTSAFSRH